ARGLGGSQLRQRARRRNTDRAAAHDKQMLNEGLKFGGHSERISSFLTASLYPTRGFGASARKGAVTGGEGRICRSRDRFFCRGAPRKPSGAAAARGDSVRGPNSAAALRVCRAPRPARFR